MSSSQLWEPPCRRCNERSPRSPIVMATSTDPVGNVVEPSTAGWQHDRTGSSADDSSPKQLELLATIVPNISRMGLLGNPSNTTSSPVLKGAQDAARAAKNLHTGPALPSGPCSSR